MDDRSRDDITTGAGGGVLATLAMSACMAAAQRAGFRHAEQPPKRIVEHVLDTADVRRPPAVDDALATVGHLAYGTSLGAVYRWARRRTQRPGPAVVHGALYGLGLWAANYAGWIPAANIMPMPHRDDRARQSAMLLAHLVFGGVLGAVADPVRGRGAGHRAA